VRSEAEELKALTAFAKAVDKAIVTEWCSRPGNRLGERIAEIRCDRIGDDEEKARNRSIQKWRDKLVELGVLKAVF
jgi:hypothetical protein